MDEEITKEEDIKNRPGPFALIFMALRLLLFMVAVSFGAFATLPLEGFLTELTYEKLAAGVAAAVVLIGAMIFAFRVPRNSILSAALDLEAIVVIAVSTIVMIVAGFITISASGGRNFLTFAVILMAIYTFYVYKAIYGALKIQRENENLKRKYGELLEIDKEKSNFITVTSHQLRTPLTEIRWALGAAAEQGPDATVRGVLQKSLDSINNLINIVNGMIGAAAVEKGTTSKKNEEIDVSSLLEEIINNLGILAGQKETAVNFSSSERKLSVRGDREKIKSALRGIIDNAIRYSPKGNVRVNCRAEGDKVSIRVEDSGIGIAPEDTERVFRRFFRGKNALLAEPNGSGMGLYRAKEIIEKNGGGISFISTLGKGTIFLITLPLAK